MLELNSFAQGGLFIGSYYQDALRRVRGELEGLGPERFAANSDEELTAHLAGKYGLEPIERDPQRETHSEHEREFRDSQDRIFDRPMRVELEYARITMPFVPKRSNATGQGR